jgi:hypothetical protein
LGHLSAGISMPLEKIRHENWNRQVVHALEIADWWIGDAVTLKNSWKYL